MERGHLEFLSGNRFAAEVAVDFDSWALELEVSADSPEGFYLFEATEALNLEALALIFNVLLQIV
jgi:hypothetical protein